MNEGVIIPININIPPTDINILNNIQIFKDLNILFINTEESYYKDGVISIGVRGLSKYEILAKVGHELIHAIQDERSNKRYLDFHNWINKYWIRFLQTNSNDSEHFNKIKQNLITIKDFSNPYERMAYAYEFVKVAKKLNLDINKALKQVIVAYPEFKQDKQFMKYFYEYYQKNKY